jgi:hypothetical protein
LSCISRPTILIINLTIQFPAAPSVFRFKIVDKHITSTSPRDNARPPATFGTTTLTVPLTGDAEKSLIICRQIDARAVHPYNPEFCNTYPTKRCAFINDAQL